MAQKYITDAGVTLIVPGTYVDVSVRAGVGGNPVGGVITIVGEADQGPGFLDEENLADVVYSPSQEGQVLRKYGSGRIVDAFKIALAAANDPNILGSVNQVRIIKTNQSTQAQAIIETAAEAAFAAIKDRAYGLSGNLIKYLSATSQSDVAPTSGELLYTPTATTVNFNLRVNGKAVKPVAVSAKANDLATLMEDLNLGILATGGSAQDVVSSGTLAAAPDVDGNLVVTSSVGFALLPELGDIMVIPDAAEFGAVAASIIAGTSDGNIGTYKVAAVTPTVITLEPIEAGTLESVAATPVADKPLLLISKVQLTNISGDRKLATLGMNGTMNVTVSGNEAIVDMPASWSIQPKAGDKVVVKTLVAGLAVGFYEVSQASTNSMTLTRLSDGSAGTSGSASINVLTEAQEPFQTLAKSISGQGKTLTIEGDVDAILQDLEGGSVSNQQWISAAEQKNTMTYMKNNVSESFTSGGSVVMTIGCTEADAEMDIQDDTIEFKVNSVVRFATPFKQFKTLQQVVDFVNSHTNFQAQLTSAKWGGLTPSDLDNGIVGISGILGHKNGRVKADAWDWNTKNSESAFIEVVMSQKSGLPEENETEQFLAGGIKGGTTSALALAAIDAAKKLSTNFVIPLFSCDATEDILNEETEPTSTYAIDAINSYVQAHCLQMSQTKQRKNRIGLVSKRARYNDVKEAAMSLNSWRTYMTFEDFKVPGSTEWKQPWAGSMFAAGMACAAGYKGIVKKFINTSGTKAPYGDFSADEDAEDALVSGILFTERVATGGTRWMSDQSTYTTDNNFVYNSLQAVYVSDLMVLTLIDTFDRLVVGKTAAEVSAETALSILDAQMFDFLRLRWIAKSDDAIKGYKNAKVLLKGPVLSISFEAKINGIIYFVPISMELSQVEQAAEG